MSKPRFVAVCLLAGCTILGLGGRSIHAAPITFDAVCTGPTLACAAAPSFSFSITLDSTVVVAGGSYDTASDGGAGFLGWAGTSSVGFGGINISGTYGDIQDIPEGMTFTFNSSGEMSSLSNNDLGNPPLTFFGSSDRRFIFRGPNVFDARWGPGNLNGTDLLVNWVSTTPTSVPAPGAAVLFGLALAGLGMAARRRAAR